MQFSRRKKQHGDLGVVITSLLDINFLLIMFFLMTAHFQRETHALLELPVEKGEENARPDESGLVINITAGGEIIVSRKAIELNQLRSRVQEQINQLRAAGDAGPLDSASLKLMVRADRNAGTEDLNRVVVLLREMGVGAIRIATEVPQ